MGIRARLGYLGIALAAAAIVSIVPPLARATDLGVQGTVWPIIEVDMRALLMTSLAQTNWKTVQSKLKDSAQTYLNGLPKREAYGVAHTRTRWLDPSFTLGNDIWAPVKDKDGNYKWQILYQKGTRINPLAYQRPYNAMLFFDGASATQVAFVAAAMHRFPGKLMPVEATGMNPSKLSQKLDFPVFTETAAMAERFNITETPSLLYPGYGTHRLALGLTTFGPPFSLDALRSAWPEGLALTAKGVHP